METVAYMILHLKQQQKKINTVQNRKFHFINYAYDLENEVRWIAFENLTWNQIFPLIC